MKTKIELTFALQLVLYTRPSVLLQETQPEHRKPPACHWSCRAEPSFLPASKMPTHAVNHPSEADSPQAFFGHSRLEEEPLFWALSHILPCSAGSHKSWASMSLMPVKMLPVISVPTSSPHVSANAEVWVVLQGDATSSLQGEQRVIRVKARTHKAGKLAEPKAHQAYPRNVHILLSQ